jgi:hypothetical protein
MVFPDSLERKLILKVLDEFVFELISKILSVVVTKFELVILPKMMRQIAKDPRGHRLIVGRS